MKTCTKDNCDRAHRARGLCASHYNQEHAPNRHAKKMVSCAWCGTEVLKGTGGGRKHGAVCSNDCRTNLTGKRESKAADTKCKLPADHWALWFGKTSTWPRAGWKDCTFCGNRFPAKMASAKYCNLICARRWHDRNRVMLNGGTPAPQMLATIRQCAWCDAPYQHVAKTRIHCSDLCRDEAKAARGRPLFHGWIANSVRLSIYERDNYTCWLCHDTVDMQADPKRDDWAPSLDHVMPRSKGGTHDHTNLLTAHRWCNSVRSDNDHHPLFATSA